MVVSTKNIFVKKLNLKGNVIEARMDVRSKMTSDYQVGKMQKKPRQAIQTTPEDAVKKTHRGK